MNEAETLFAQQLLDAKLKHFVREYKFHDQRLWRFDFAFVAEKLAVEIDGGIWTQGGGRHNRPEGYIKDCKKYAEAAILGWRVIRVPTEWVTQSEKALNLVRRALNV